MRQKVDQVTECISQIIVVAAEISSSEILEISQILKKERAILPNSLR
jgi:hypothetical protein